MSGFYSAANAVKSGDLRLDYAVRGGWTTMLISEKKKLFMTIKYLTNVQLYRETAFLLNY